MSPLTFKNLVALQDYMSAGLFLK